MGTRHKWHPVCPAPRDLVRPVPVDPTGMRGPTKAQAAGPRWRRTSRGFYVPAHVGTEVPEQRILEQSMRLPAGGAVTGWAACRLHGAGFFDGLGRDGRTRLPVPLALGAFGQLTATADSVALRDRLDPGEVTVRSTIPCVTVLRALFDAARTAPSMREAVVAIDMVAAAELASRRQLHVYLRERAGWRGVPQVRDALALASERSRSPNETRTRLVWQLDAGLPRPLVNQPVWDLRGRLLGIADLFDPEAGLVGEYDGADHRGGMRQAKDAAREEGFRRAGLEYLKITGPDLRSTPLMVDRIQATRSRALWLPPAQRRWTLQPPPDYDVELPLHERLELREWQQSLWRQYDAEGSPHVPNVS